MTFLQKLEAAQTSNRSWVCVGLDPDPEKLPTLLQGGWAGVLPFCLGVIRETADLVCAYKPNLGFFLSHGAEGIETLEAVVSYIPHEIPIILDAKFGDNGSTAEQYAKFTFAHLGVDAVTISPYIGTDAIGPFLAYPEKLVFVLS